jgi:hypothetical protein
MSGSVPDERRVRNRDFRLISGRAECEAHGCGISFATQAPKSRCRMKKTIFAILATLGLQAVVMAEEQYPTRPITIVVPFTAGGPLDVITRIVGGSHVPNPRPANRYRKYGGGGRRFRVGPDSPVATRRREWPVCLRQRKDLRSLSSCIPAHAGTSKSSCFTSALKLLPSMRWRADHSTAP